MSCCPTCGGFAPAPIQGANNTVPSRTSPLPPTALVRDPNYRPTLTPYRSTDVHTALARGLAEYLSQQAIDVAGRRINLVTYSTWAEPEQNVTYPAAGVGAGTGSYDRSFTPSVLTSFDDTRLMAFSEFTQELSLELWATDPKERAFLVAMIEEALNPVDWMYGLRLVLPFYHGTTATYELLTSQYTDTADDSMNRYRKAMFTIKGHITAMRLLRFPNAKPQARISVFDPDVVSTQDVDSSV